MAEIEFTLPTVQYGNVKVKATPEELGLALSDATELGIQAAVYLNLFTQGFKVGATLDVGPSKTTDTLVDRKPERTISEIMSDEDVDTVAEAQAILDKELGGVTEVSDDAPWKQKVQPKVKDWEQPAVPAELSDW